MARGDGKALKGRTKGNPVGVKRMALGGFMGGKPSGGNQSPSGSMGGFGGQASRAEAGGAGGGGGNNFGASPRDGGFGGVARNYPDDRRVDLRGNPNTFARTERTSALTSPDSMKARLGPNAAQAMVDAGMDPELSRLAADSINKRATDSPSILGDRDPGQRLATVNKDRSITYSPVPERKFPTAAPVGTLGSFGTASTTATPESPMAVYGDEFSFTPEQTTKALRSMYDARLPGASYKELMGLKKAMKDPANKAMASTLSAPFSSKTRAPVKSITDRVDQDPDYSSKDQESLLGTSTPTLPKGSATKTTNISQTSPDVTALAKVQLPKARPEGLSTAAKPTKIADIKKATPKEGSIFVKDGTRYQIRDGKAYNFNVPGGSKRGKPERDARSGGRGRDDDSRGKKDGGRINGAAIRGRTKGKIV